MKPKLEMKPKLHMGLDPEIVDPRTLKDHQKIVVKVKQLIDALPADAIREPNMPVSIYLAEGYGMVTAAGEHLDALAKVGVTKAQIDRLWSFLKALESGQVIWRTELRGGRDEETARLIDDAETLRDDLVAAARLALRKNREGKRRLDGIREGEGLPDLISDLNDLAVLITDAAELFEAIKMDVTKQSNAAAAMRDALREELAVEDVGRSLSGSKEQRDRLYTLCHQEVGEMRAFAAFAFRKDKTNKRRGFFASSHLRRKNRRSRRAQVQNPILTPAPELTEPVPAIL